MRHAFFASIRWFAVLELACGVLFFGAEDCRAQCQSFEFANTGPSSGPVAVDGDLAVSSELNYVSFYHWVAPSWVREDTVPTGPDTPFCVAIRSDGVAAVSVEDAVGNWERVYIYQRNSTSGTWSRTQVIDDPAAPILNWFGLSLAFGSGGLIVGAPYDNAGGNQRGIAYQYVQVGGTTWSLAGTISSPMLVDQELFGNAVRMDGEFLVVGAPQQSHFVSGAVYVFRLTPPTTWALEVRETSVNSSHLGRAVAVTIDPLTGMQVLASDWGSVRVYQRSTVGPSWSHVQTLAAPAGSSAYFGDAIATSGTMLLVGDWPNGLAHFYVRESPYTGPWFYRTAFTNSDPIAHPQFGKSLDLPRSGEFALIAASGVADFFRVGEADCNGNGMPDVCEPLVDCNGNGVFDACEAGPAAITTSPAARLIYPGGETTFSVTATGYTPLSFQWTLNDIPLADGGVVSGAQTPNLSLTGAGTSMEGDYRCEVIDGCGNLATSAPAHLDFVAGTVTCEGDGSNTATYLPFGLPMGLSGWPGAAASVLALTVFDDGTGPALYAAGDFTLIGSQLVNRIARWNGTSWVPLGSGLSGGIGRVDTLAVYDPDGSGPAAATLYAAGGFTNAGGVPVSNIARWNGTAWSAAGSGTNGEINALHVWDQDGSGPITPRLFAGGLFTTAGSVSASRIAAFDGSAWSSLALGVSGPVYALQSWNEPFFGPALYVAGDFTMAGTVQVYRLARWTGTAWMSANAPSYVDRAVRALALFDPDGTGPQPERMYAAGEFASLIDRIGGVPGGQWNLVAGLPGAAMALATLDNGPLGRDLIAGGNGFAPLGSVTANVVRILAGAGTTVLGEGVDGPVLALLPWDGAVPSSGQTDLILGGVFQNTGGSAPFSMRSIGRCIVNYAAPVCPCMNFGSMGHGCANSTNSAGGLLMATGVPSHDTLVLRGSGMPATSTCIYLQGEFETSVGFGDGVLCASGALIRLRTKINSSGASQFPEAGDPSVSVRGQVTPGSGASRIYQTYYRNAASYCTSATFNVTNAIRITW